MASFRTGPFIACMLVSMINAVACTCDCKVDIDASSTSDLGGGVDATDLDADDSAPSPLVILNAMAMTSESGCQVGPGSSDQPLLPYGILDLALTNGYWIFPRFENRVEPGAGGPDQGGSEASSDTGVLTILKATIRVDMGEFAPLNSDSTKVKETAAKYMNEGVDTVVSSSVGPGEMGVVAVQAIRPDLGNIFDAKMQTFIAQTGTEAPAVWVTIAVKFSAETVEKAEFQSNEFMFPVQLCWGCLVLSYTEEEPGDWPCYPGQDVPLSCTACPVLATHPGACPSCS